MVTVTTDHKWIIIHTLKVRRLYIHAGTIRDVKDEAEMHRVSYCFLFALVVSFLN